MLVVESSIRFYSNNIFYNCFYKSYFSLNFSILIYILIIVGINDGSPRFIVIFIRRLH